MCAVLCSHLIRLDVLILMINWLHILLPCLNISRYKYISSY